MAVEGNNSGPLESFEFVVQILEIEWLGSEGPGDFYIALKNKDPVVFENETIKFLSEQINFA